MVLILTTLANCIKFRLIATYIYRPKSTKYLKCLIKLLLSVLWCAVPLEPPN